MISDDLLDFVVRHQVFLEGLKAGQTRDMNALFAQLDLDLTKLLMELRLDGLSELTTAQGGALVEAIRQKNVTAYTKHMNALIKTLKDLAADEATFELDVINEVTVDDVEAADDDFRKGGVWAWVKDRPISATGALLGAYLATWGATESTRAADLARKAIAEGWSKERLLRAYRGTKANGRKDGLFWTARHNTATTINTAIQHVSHSARAGAMERIRLYPDAGAPGKRDTNGVTMAGYRWVSVLDSRTSQICRSLDGRVFDFGKGPLPPAHPNCRSTIIVAIDGRYLREQDRRGDYSGQTYYDWLKKQPQEFQEAALGKTRARLFRDGGLSATQFAALNLNRDFRPLSLAEMRKLNPLIFKRAGL